MPDVDDLRNRPGTPPPYLAGLASAIGPYVESLFGELNRRIAAGLAELFAQPATPPADPIGPHHTPEAPCRN